MAARAERARQLNPATSSSRDTPDSKVSRMALVSIVAPAPADTAAAQASTSPSPAAPTGTKARPGLVQNWPDPRAIDAARPSPMAGPRSSAAAGVTTRGFTLPSSP